MREGAMMKAEPYIRWFEEVGSQDVMMVGGKNASLGEMFRALSEKQIRVPDGFAVTTEAYRTFLEGHDLTEKIRSVLDELQRGGTALEHAGESLRALFLRADFPDDIAQAIRTTYRDLSRRYHRKEVDVAVRSSASAEDLPEASFAGQHESFLNVRGEEALLEACRRCYASLFTDRAISYRTKKGFDHLKVALSIGVQKMVRADRAGAGVMFSIDTETGFPNAVVINAAWGLGELVVQGKVTPDEYRIFKPLLETQGMRPILGKALGDKGRKLIYAKGSQATKNIKTSKTERDSFVLNDQEILQLARWACAIEAHYGKPVDMEWAKDGETGELYIVQARPETVHSPKQAGALKTYRLKQTGHTLVTGLSIGEAIAAGKARVIHRPEESDRFEDGAILVTDITDPDWVPIMSRAAGIVTDRGGRTSHAAIVSRELGVPAVIGCGDATTILNEGQGITISCAEGAGGVVYDGILEFEESAVNLENVPTTRTQIMMNIASPAAGFRWWRLPCDGIGLARMEFIINNTIKIHPMALVRFEEIKDPKSRKRIEEVTRGYQQKTEFFVDRLARGIAEIAASQYPKPVIVRTSDFKTSEYAELIGGKQWEPVEENPMLGFRGASRYYSDRYREGFALECRAIKRAREEIGLINVIVMIPFCRTPEEADQVLTVLDENALKRGQHELQVYAMAEIPSNIVLAKQFAERFDGFSIGSNDLTQLVLGVDRDSEELSHLFDERHEAVKMMIRDLIVSAHEANRKVGICGQAPSDHPDFAAFLVKTGIDSISLNPDSVIEVKRRVAQAEGEA
jgi:pyruvate,water dikinase